MKLARPGRRISVLFPLVVLSFSLAAGAADDAETFARQVTIHRDEWGVPHIEGPTDASVVFGFAYAQAEDYFWQVEDSYIRALGRSAEVWGEEGLEGDMRNRLFRIAQRSERDFERLPEELQAICNAYAAGIDHYLERHPGEARLLEGWQGWWVLAFERHMLLDWMIGRSHAPQRQLRPLLEEMEAATGSNGWALGPKKTKDGTTMLFINPHQPWFGSGQFTEGHLKSGEGWNFSGTTYPGGPFPTFGHNEVLGWTHTANAPDLGDVYRESFDHPSDPLLYRYDGGWRRAEEWTDTIRVKTDSGLEDRIFTFRETHHGPVIARQDEVHFLAVKLARLFEGSRMVQALAAAKARSFEEWKEAFSAISLQMFNTIYADRDGNIFYLYNGAVPRRDPSFDWARPVDGADPATEWQGLHSFRELPQVLNPPSGWVQNCNQSPFTTTDVGNPHPGDFPPYMVEEKDVDLRRAKVSRHLLRSADKVSFEDLQRLAFDTTLYWAMTEIPRYARLRSELEETHPELAARVEPYLEHLMDWDFRSSVSSTQTTLTVFWYEELYGRGYPVETLKPELQGDPPARLQALVHAAERLEELYGAWRVPYGEVFRLQRHANYSDPSRVPFSDERPSLPQVGVRGPLGVVFTVYHTPPTAERRRQYAVVGASYMAVVEFRQEGVRAVSYLHFGQRARPDSPHFFDQAELLSQRRFKPAWFDWDEVLAHTVASYHPGQEGGAPGR